jgi:23S rRNA (guanine2445-N2)-methyltransferase / 23S rRNA (guanine2069-N7)-methyltransferase
MPRCAAPARVNIAASMTTHSFFAPSAIHLEALLAEELTTMGATGAVAARGGAAFSGSVELAYRACLWSRVASRVLLVLARFPAATPDALYEGVRSIRWGEHLRGESTLAVDCKAMQSSITHAHYAALKVKDAVVDQLRDDTGTRPSVDLENPDLRIHARVRRDEATISIDLAGEPMHRRGYRARGVAAPLKENLAAAILLRAQWPRIASEGGELADPMCGSGTLPIEAALIAADIAPGLLRERWGFEGWAGHERATWEALLREARERREAGRARKIAPLRGYDHEPAAVRTALANVERAGLGHIVHVERQELEDCAPTHAGANGLLVANPPYGERIGARGALPELYARLGRVMRDRFQGWRAAVLASDAELGHRLGLRATKVHTLYNGRIECRLLHFEIGADHTVARLPRPAAPEARSSSAAMLANRLRKNQKHLARWLAREGISCYRLYDADLPEYALAIDVYEGAHRWIHVQEYAPPKSIDPAVARNRLREALGVIIEVLDADESQLFLKTRRPQKARSQYEKLGSSGAFREVSEDGCRLLVNLEDYLDTGLFLDQRLTRRMLRELADGRDFLNLFGYTGAATVHAARGGARSTTTVDLSRTYLDWARRNLELNGFTASRHALIQADCLRWLEEPQARRGLIFLEPPTFSTSKRMRGTLDVQRDHASLIDRTARLLVPGGVLIFSTNLRTFAMDREALPHLAFEDLSRATLPKDFERSPRMHRCWRITVRKE